LECGFVGEEEVGEGVESVKYIFPTVLVENESHLLRQLLPLGVEEEEDLPQRVGQVLLPSSLHINAGGLVEGRPVHDRGIYCHEIFRDLLEELVELLLQFVVVETIEVDAIDHVIKFRVVVRPEAMEKLQGRVFWVGGGKEMFIISSIYDLFENFNGEFIDVEDVGLDT